MPTARDPWSLLSQAPGVLVDRINVGGNESGQQSNFLGLGSGGRDNTFAVDGVVLTDMNAVGGSADLLRLRGLRGGPVHGVERRRHRATSGVTINQVTKRGTNEWKGDGPLPATPTAACRPAGAGRRQQDRQRWRSTAPTSAAR